MLPWLFVTYLSPSRACKRVPSVVDDEGGRQASPEGRSALSIHDLPRTTVMAGDHTCSEHSQLQLRVAKNCQRAEGKYSVSHKYINKVCFN